MRLNKKNTRVESYYDIYKRKEVFVVQVHSNGQWGGLMYDGSPVVLESKDLAQLKREEMFGQELKNITQVKTRGQVRIPAFA